MKRSRKAGLCCVGNERNVGRVGSIIMVRCVDGIMLKFGGIDIDVTTVGVGIGLNVEIGVIIIDPKFRLIVEEMGDGVSPKVDVVGGRKNPCTKGW